MMMMSDNNGNIKTARHQHQHELHSSRVTSNGHAHPKVALSDLAQAHQAHQVVHPSSIVLVSSNDISSPEMITSPSSHSTISTPSPMSVSNCIPQFVHPNDNDAINNNSSLVTQSNTTSNRLASQANNNNQANLSTSSVVNSTSTTMTNSAGNTTTPSTTPIFALPDILESIQRSDHFPLVRHRWNTNEEIAALLIAIDRHDNWLSLEVKIRPKSGSMMLYSRKRVRYRRDGYCWKKRKDGKTTREDHMKLKVQGIECIYGCYVHSAILPTFHRRCYWLLQNPDIVLVHYLNVPYNDDNKVITPSLNFFIDSRKEWTRDDLICELKPMFLNENENDLSDQLEKSTIDTVESIVAQLMVRQRAKLKALEDSNVDAPMGRNCNGAKLAAIQPASNAHLKQFAHKHHQQQQLQIISGLSQSGHAIIGTTNLGRGKGQGSGNCTVNTVANGKRDVSTACTMISTAALQAAEEDNTGIDVNGNLIAANQSKAIQPAATVQLVQLTSPHGMCQLSGASATAGTAAGTLVDGATLGHPQTSPTSLILNLSGLQAPAGSSFFILNSTTTSQTSALSVSGAHHQLTNTTRLVNTVTSEGAANAQATTGTGTPVAFFYPTRTGSTNELTTTRLLCTNGLPSALGGSFVTESVVKSSIFANGTLDPSVMTSILGGGSGAGDELKHVTIKQEFDEDNNEMEMDSSCVHAELINNKRFNLDEDEEEKMMICSEPSSPERLINSNLTAFLTDGQDIKLEPDFLVSEHQHGNNSQCCHSKSHSTLNTSDLTNDENDFDWKFDSLFGNDSSLMSSCLQNEHNFGYSGSKSSLVTDHLMSSTSHASHFSSSPNSSHPMIIHHRNPHTHHHQPATQTQNTFLASHSSQRDINLNQSSAMHVSSHEQHSPFDGHSMDFMDNEDIPTSDEILFGLDAFDIFSDFDHLVDDLSEDSHTNHHQQHQSQHCANQANDSGSGNNVHSDCVYSNGQQCYRQSPLCNASLSTITSSSSSASTVTISLSSSSSSGLLSSGSSSQYNSPSTESASTTASQLSNYKGNHVGNCLTSNATTSVSANLSPTVGHNRDNSSSNQTATASAGNKKCLGSTLIIDHSNGNEIDSAASRQPLTNEHQQPDHVNPSESDVCHSIAVTVDENGNVSMVRTSSNTNTIGNSNQNNGSTTRRAASAGHQSRQAHLKELNQVHKSSDTSLNDISDGDEGHSQFVSNYPHRTRQRHMSDIYSSGHSGRSSKETISDRSSTRGAVHDSNGNNISSSTRTSRSTNTTATIADYSPEWCYPEGGIKVLVAGPWYHTETDTYSIHFDGVSVPTQLVQTGLLRCFSPKHEPGFVTLQVSCNDLIISNSVIFEYRAHTEVSPQKTPDYFSFDENLFRATLLERCDKLNRASSSTGGSNNELLKQFLLDNNGNMSHQANNSQFESRLVQWFDSLLSSGVVNVTAQHNENDQFEDKSFLHLAVGLNLPQLTERALRVHSKLSQSLSDEQKKKCFFFGQVDPSARDLEDNTPLSWACWLGHVELVEMFVRHEPNVIHHTNSTGQTPLDIAIERGHHRIARLIEMSQMSSTSNQATTDKCPSTTSTNNNSNNLNNANDHLSDDNNKPGKNKASALTATASLMAKLTDIKAMSSGVCCRQWDDNNRLEGKESLVHCCSSSIDCATVNKKANTVGHKNIDSTLTDDDSMSEENSSSSRAVLTIAENIIAAMPHRIKSNVIESINSGEMSLDSYVQSDDDRLESSIKGGKPDEAKFDLQSLDDLILYLEQQHNQLSHLERTESECSGSSEIDYYYSTGNRLLSTNSGQHSLASQDSLESCSFGEAESLTLMSYRDVQRSPSLANSSPSNSIDGTNSIYSPSNYSLDSLPSSPPPTTSELCEYFRSGSITSELSNLTLTECEQRELYEAAQVIQKAYRLYKGRKDHLESLKHENSAESAAIIIQNYYRRYKQYLYYCNNQTSKGRKDKIVLSEPMEHHSSEPKRFKKSVTTYDEITDDEVDEGMYSCTTGTASSDISMSNSTAQSDVDDDDSGQGAIEDIDEGVITAFCGGTFSSEEDNDDETLVKLYDTNTSLQVKGSTSRATYRAQHTINHNNKRSLLQ